ncbi:MAG TPA: tripartite tricarboxylate transporter substrate binding protein [Xanthobacteraceae bacterium]|jgi:tripartite-type tricarboxylate transporter receptor subunit TctC|nr:tripartite tricarboxylate transporter substrate binding protein [Xanthobacteraceae bacterium]
MRHFRTVAALFAVICLAVAPASAQGSYPSKPITMVVPFGAGGALDLIARVLADGLRNELGQPVIVDNKPGASGLLAMRLAAGAAPDGYTIILSSESNHVLLPLLDKNFPLDVGKEFLPVSLSGQFQHTLIVKKELPVGSVQELVAYLRANPGKLSFGSSGVGTQAHIAGEFLSLLTDSKMVHVPYRSSPAALNDLLAGNLDINFQSMPAVRSYIDSPRLKMLAVLSAQRLKELPDVPTMIEAGFPDFQLSSWMGLFGPAGLPDDIRRRLSDALVKVGKVEEVQTRIRGAGIEPVGSDAASFARFVEAENKKWKTFVDRTGIKLNQ